MNLPWQIVFNALSPPEHSVGWETRTNDATLVVLIRRIGFPFYAENP